MALLKTIPISNSVGFIWGYMGIYDCELCGQVDEERFMVVSNDSQSAVCKTCIFDAYVDIFSYYLPPRRVPVKEEVRQAIFKRDAYTCQDCGRHDSLSIDHIQPYSKGGSNDISNLQTLCRRCNSKKSAKWEEKYGKRETY